MSAVGREPITSGLEGPPVPSGHAFVSEVFSGIQGEGPYVGVRQIFVRLGGCDLRCWWCDTPASLVRRGPAVFETRPGSREFIEVPNPVPLSEVSALLAALDPAFHHSVTFTGGEPLLQPEAVFHLAERVHEAGGMTWLETHGGRVAELREVVETIDFVSMDFKLPSSSGDYVPLDVHGQFLRIATSADVFAKVVITPDTRDEEVLSVASLIASVDAGIVLVLQQVTPFGRIKEPPTPEQMLRVQDACTRVHPNTRVIPQTHRFTGQR